MFPSDSEFDLISERMYRITSSLTYVMKIVLKIKSSATETVWFIDKKSSDQLESWCPESFDSSASENSVLREL